MQGLSLHLCISCTGGQILHHWATWEVPHDCLLSVNYCRLKTQSQGFGLKKTSEYTPKIQEKWKTCRYLWGISPQTMLIQTRRRRIVQEESSHLFHVNFNFLSVFMLSLRHNTWCTAAVKSLQSCPTLCDPIDVSPPGFPVPGILQARTLEWVAISFSNAWKWKVKVKLLSRIGLLATPWTAAHQAPPPMGFSRQEY